ncbi:metallophosphoesterase [Tissierella pigra]|uniref:Serine/threonine protein phosphatase n=1 Tax=Tissierella pigra TaxID=2607614 RepID=A0A6N7XSR3_9FIRM|nr:metallophosphoesterase [Tissierella pigra]MSU00797.1 serine/threonine protein phosphatase [Tissierella pigra]
MIFAIGDLHFDNTGKKPMDIFGDNWLNHEEEIINNWKKVVGENDLVLLAGDISWALKLEEAYEDLMKIESLPGRKIIIKGNHDYWWSSLKKLNDFQFKTIEFIQNNSFIHGSVGIVGTRGWSSIDTNESDEKNQRIFNRELNRLKLSLDSLQNKTEKIIVVLHYPPFNPNLSTNEFVNIMRDYDVDICIYGHLHSEGHKYVVEGNIDEIQFHCVSCDYIDFMPKKILEE